MKNALLLAAAVSALAAAAASAEPLAYPGAAWGALTSPPTILSNFPESNDWVYQGRITQGVDWSKFKGWTFDTYASFGYAIDTKGIDWDNHVDPALGIKISRPVTHGNVEGNLNLSAQVVYDRRFGNSFKSAQREGTGVQVIAEYWFGWH